MKSNKQLTELIAELGEGRGIGVPFTGELDVPDDHGVDQLLLFRLLTDERFAAGLLWSVFLPDRGGPREEIAEAWAGESRHGENRRQEQGQDRHREGPP